MPIIQINGVSVDFPKDPYNCQVEYMGKVIQALSAGENALLESPTGTGKTLSLLCSSLAWQSAHAASAQAAPASSQSSNHAAGSQPSSDRNGVIVYATRTHSQLSQVIRELRDTSYRPKMAVLGSRDQLCIHDKVSKLKTASLNHACQVAVSRHTCQFKNNLESMIDGGSAFVASNEVTDIEDLVKMGRRRVVCPYYYSRDSSATADIVFMPYNYLLDGAIRKTIKINLQNSIVIFDEAHNLEQVASDAASCSFSSADLAACIQEMQQILEILKAEHSRKADSGSSLNKASKTESGVERPSLPASVAVLRALFELEKIFDRVVLTHNADTDTSCAIHPGSWLVNALIHAGFNSDSTIDCVRKCALLLMDEAEQALNGLASAGAALPTPEPKLSAFASAMDRVLSTGRVEHADFQVFISEELQKGRKAVLGSSNVTQLFHQANQPKKRVVNFWCFSTGVALKNLKEQGVRSIILTSGTLSPMEAMKEDLRLPFTVELQNPHVVGASQVWIGAIGKSNADKSLNSSFANRDTTTYKDELGQSILDISSTLLSRSGAASSPQGTELSSTELQTIRGGVLVFFPAYHLMDSTIERWKFTGLFKKLSAVAGSVVVESRSKFKSSLSSTEETSIVAKAGKKLDENDADQEGLVGLIAEFEDAIAKRGSCMLLAVCRGKAAEGVDFSDRKGRVVIVTGIPFAPYKDPWVVLKRLYLDAKCSGRLTAPSSSSSSTSSVYSNNPNIYAAKLGLTSTPVNSAVPMPSASSNDYAQAGNVWAAARQSVTSSAATAGQGSNAVALVGKSGGQVVRSSTSLSGAMWYQQSASRAVNQCLGRVIRHRNDWGAICLLDERFLQDRQASQLSEWMRPIVKKHPRLSDALKTLKQFFQAVARDDRLRITSVPAEVPMPPPPAIRPISLPRPPADPPTSKSIITRIVEISETQLPQSQDDPASYIDQHLLMSQPSEQSFRGETSSDSEFFPFSQLRPGRSELSRPRAAGSQPNVSATLSIDLKTKLDRLKARDQVEKMASTKAPMDPLPGRSFGGLSSTNAWTSTTHSSSLLATPVISLIDDEPLGKTSSTSVASFGLSQQAEDDPFSQMSSAGSLLGSQPTPSNGSSQKRSSAVTAAAFSSIVQPLQSSLATSTSTAEQIKQLLVKWKASLSAMQQETLRGILVLAAREGLQHPSQMKAFHDQFAQLVGAVWSLEDQTTALKSLVVLVKGSDKDELGNRRELYLQLVTQRYQRLLKKRRIEQLEREEQETQEEQEQEKGGQGGGKDTGMSSQPTGSKLEREGLTSMILPLESSQAREGERSTPLCSKRAQQLLQRVSGATPSTSSSLLSRLHSLSSLELAGSRADRMAASSESQGNGSTRLQCSVCKEVADQPCAAKCGHICCQQCWISWLKVKPSCPICRAPASQQSVARVLIRSEKSSSNKVSK